MAQICLLNVILPPASASSYQSYFLIITCVCARTHVCVCACACVPSCLSNSINKCTYTPPLQKPCLFTVPHKLLTLWTLSSLAQFNIQSQQQKQQQSPPFTTIHKQPFAPSLATYQVFFLQPKHVIISLIQNL